VQRDGVYLQRFLKFGALDDDLRAAKGGASDRSGTFWLAALDADDGGRQLLWHEGQKV